ncbi:MAG TPA: dTDP-4-dehydrorhamnose reductase [Gemmataceae bacterium]|nr:dTDP-4-dehydrorhamnose reductase [Gemmataceae bacterium]
MVLGAPGQLGRDLCPRLRGEVVPLGRADVDLTDQDSLRARLTSVRPDVVINCAAYNFVDKAETEPLAAFAVNTWAVRGLAMICRDFDSTLVQFSSDYVFGLAADENPLTENDPPGPVSVYGLSKLAGEFQVRSICPKHFVIRTCGLYGISGSGGKGSNFVETMLRLAAQGIPLQVVNDQRCTPSFTADVATATTRLIETTDYGLYHLTNGSDCSWFEVAAEIFRLTGTTANLTPITSAEFAAPARRPAYSVLSNEKLRLAGVTPPRDWKEALAEYLQLRAKK